ncbi:MAG: CpaF family protein [Acidimicrobiales bacterium]
MNESEFAAVQRGLRTRVGDELVSSVQTLEAERGVRVGELDQEALTASLVTTAIADFARECFDGGRPQPTDEEEERLARAVMDDLFAAGSKLQPYLTDPDVVSIRANNHRVSWITYVDGHKERGPAFASDNVGLIELIRGLAEEAYRFDGIERRFDAGSPKLDCALPNGDRVFALMVVSGEAVFVIRRHNFLNLVTLEDLRDRGMLLQVEVDLLRAMVLGKFNIVITGGMGTGKTTLCRVCANTIPAEERKVVLEDTPELGLERFPHLHPDIVSVCPRGANVEGAGQISMGELGEWLLRAEGERFLVGEARGGGEIMPLLTAMTCGNEGSMTTIHAPSTRAAFSKLALYCARSSERLPLEQANQLIAAAVDFVVHLDARKGDGRVERHISSIREVERVQEGEIVSNEVWRRGPDGHSGPAGEFQVDTLRRLEEAGFNADAWGSEEWRR